MASDRVDREKKVIRGYAVMSLGEAKGHGMVADETTLEQLLQLGLAQPNGVKTRMRHPTRTTDSMGRPVVVHDGFGRALGKSRNFRREGDKVVADLHLSDAAFKSPEGDLGTYVMALADGEEDTFGASPEVHVARQVISGRDLPAMRLKNLEAIAIVDDPATNRGFFSGLSGDDDMADNTVDSKVTELSAANADLATKNRDLASERDRLTGEVGSLKTSIIKMEAAAMNAAESKITELSMAKTDAIAATLTVERARVTDIIALCAKTGKPDWATKYIMDGTATVDVQKALLEVLCAGNKPIGEGSAADLTAKPDEDAPYKAEYAKQKTLYLAAGLSEEDFVKTRRIDDRKDILTHSVSS